MDNAQVRSKQYPKPSLADRIITAILAPLVFNFSVVTVIALFYSFLPKKSIYVFKPYLILGSLPAIFLLCISILLPLVAGFLLGMNRFADMLGMFFPWGGGYEKYADKDIRKTISAWIVLLGYTAIGYMLMMAL